MTAKVKPIPEGYSSVTSYLCVRGAADALEYYKRAFGAKELSRCAGGPEGKIMHAEIKIGDARVMLADECPQMNFKSPLAFNGTPVTLHLYVENVDATFKQAIAAGAKEVRPVTDQFYGDRSGLLVDPFGHSWNIATHIEDVSEEEIKKRMQNFNKNACTA